MAGSAVALVTTFIFDFSILYLVFFFFFFLQLWCSGIRGLDSDLGEMDICGFTVF